jgi:hypothetical protein
MGHSTKSPFRLAAKNIPCAPGAAVLLGLLSCVSLSTCSDARRHPTTDSTAKTVLLANPNPVPAGDLDQPVASTQITWNTGDGAIGDLYVRTNRSREVFLGSGPSGTIKIDWIQFDSTYEFRLYAKKHGRLLAKLDVTRNN